jgi:hypothetical protein
MLRRLRGFVLRRAYSRRAAIAAGLALVAPAGALWLLDFAWESGLTDGFALILGATGVAFVIAGIQGRSADWVE